jgi:signal transduction histidine kinase/CheY-like chemotaxis protein
MKAPIGDEVARVDLRHDEGVVTARQRARDVAELLGFDRLEQTRIATAVSELARNAHRYAGGGEVRIMTARDRMRVEVTDSGPGIPNLDEVLSGEYTSSTGLGRGLVGVRQLMDEFEIVAPEGLGTRVTVVKRLPAGARPPDPPALREALSRRSARSPFEEVTRQNEELLQALGEIRRRQQEMLALNRELEETNQGVVALYAELDERAEQLVDADERKSRFLADMSHELRTPLNSIIALSELLLSGEPPLVGEQVTQVAFIRRVAEDQLRLVGDLLDIAKIEAGRLELEVSELTVAELFVMLRGQLRPLLGTDEVELRFDAPSAPITLRSDEDKLMQIMRNLISNALKFTPSGEVVVRAALEGEWVRFAVADTGIGIPPGDLERIFEEFVQVPGELQREGHGTGLGLPLTRKLVGLLGGTIEVESTAGAGTTFSVRLPLEGGQPPDALPDLSGAVFVVDDDEAARYVIETHLRGTAWRTVAANGGAAALAALGASLPEAMILDLAMPEVDGFEVLRRVREDERTADLPVILHTSRVLDASERKQAAALRASVLDKSETSRTGLLAALATATRRPA